MNCTHLWHCLFTHYYLQHLIIILIYNCFHDLVFNFLNDNNIYYYNY